MADLSHTMPHNPEFLAEGDWQARADRHRAAMREWTLPHQERRARGEKHPVLDFLFTYYSFPPSHLERWQPGPNLILGGDAAKKFLSRPEYCATSAGVSLNPEKFTERRINTTRFILRLLENTAAKKPQLNCFGLHEWAMVYRQKPDDLRHTQLPLRLGARETDEVVESLQIRCGHYDAFRFFTPDAVPRNTLNPTRATQSNSEQPGCLHANMDLYKWAVKLSPFIHSELIGACFLLAVDLRSLDMRASPYDLSGSGYEPVRIETPSGRAEYARRQLEFSQRAEPLRQELITHCTKLLAFSA